MKNYFYFHRNKEGIWVFGNYWITDFLGGLGCIFFGIISLFGGTIKWQK